MEMDFISRRALLGSVSVAALVGLAGCALPSGGGSVPQTLLTDAGLVLSGLKAVVGALGSVIPAAVAAKIGAIVDQVETDVASLGGAISTAAAAPTVQNIVTLVEQAIALIPAGLLPAPLGMALQAVQVLLPVLLAYVGMPAAQAMQMRAAMARMTPDEARAVLRSL